MPKKERRITPRKSCTIPIRFRTLASEFTPVAVGAAASRVSGREFRIARPQPDIRETIEGETLNLSERGIRFKSAFRFSVGDSVEIYFTLPRELTGRSPEEVRCHARVVHIENNSDADGMMVAGAVVEQFEPLHRAQNWSN